MVRVFDRQVSPRTSVQARARMGSKALRRTLLVSTMVFVPVPGFADIGTVAAVNRDMEGTPPSAVRRALELGNQVVQEELIQTSPIGSGQLMFKDQTTLTVAPNSDIVLDQYVYDPESQTGEIAISLTKGALRFIGGRISKNRDAVVSTPTATIGIRGGLTVVQVSETGETNVIHMAGEYSSITDTSGKTVTLSRANASASSSQEGGAQYTGIVDSEGLSDVYESFEGEGDGGSDTLEDVGDTGSDNNSGSSTQADGSDQSGEGSGGGGTTALVEEELGEIADLNSDSEGGATDDPVSTSGESPAAEAEQIETVEQQNAVIDSGSGSNTNDDEDDEVVVVDPVDPVDPADPADPVDPVVVDPVVVDPVVVDPVDPVVTPTDLTGGFLSEPTGLLTFDTVEEGSLIGTAGAEVITIPVPETSADFVTTFSDGTTPVFFAKAIGGANTGFFEFPFPAPGEEALGSSTTLGVVEGRGFTDLDNDFHFLFVQGPLDANGDGELGAVVFGDASLNQLSFSEDAGVPATTNVVETFVIEQDLTELDGGADGSDGNLFIVSNASETRFDHPSNNRTFTPGASRVLAADFRTNDFGQGITETEFFVLSDTLFEGGDGGGLRFGTNTFGIFSDSGVGGSGTFISESPIGTFEDGDRNSIFGTDNNYLVLSSATRADQSSPFVIDTSGQERELAGQPITGFGDEGFSTLATRDTGGVELIVNPLSLADAPDNADSSGPVLRGFASGIASCIGAPCGVDRDGDRIGDQTYAVTGTADFFFIDGTTPFVPDPDNNSLASTFELEVASEAVGNETLNETLGLILPTSPDGTNSAYLDDRRFAGIGGDGRPGSVSVGGSSLPGGAFALASFPLTSDAGLLANPNPEFLRFGVWGAVYAPDSANAPGREDAVPAGFFVAGAPTDLNLLPPSGVAEFNGEALGTRVDASATRTVQTGSFNLQYDFNIAEGVFDLNIAEFDFTNVPIFEAASPDRYSYSHLQFTQDIVGDGRIFSGGGNPFAATAGNFLAKDLNTGVEVAGVFGAENSNFDPNGALTPVGGVSEGAFFSELTGFVGFEDTFDDTDLRFGSGFPEGGSAVEEVTIIVPVDDNEFIDPSGTNEGLFQFGASSGFPDGFSSSLGNLGGTGFSDLDDDFHAYTVAGDPDQNGLRPVGVVAFGTPEGTQASLPLNDAFVTGGNVFTPLAIGTDIARNPSGGFGLIGDAFLVSNSGQARFIHPSHTFSANGGRIGGASFDGGINSGGAFQQQLTIFADALTNDGTGGLRFGGFGFQTTTLDATIPSSTVFAVGTLEDFKGDTVYDGNDLRFVTSSAFRPDPGTEYQFFAEEKTNGQGTTVEAGSLNVVTINETLSETIPEPLSIALGPQSAGVLAAGASGAVAVPILTGFASARAQCGNGNCGGLRPNQVGTTRSYELGGTATFAFDGDSQNLDDANFVIANFNLNSDENDNVPSVSGATEYSFAVGGLDSTVYADDKTFVGVGFTAEGAVIDTPGISGSDAVFGFASGNVLGDTELLRTTADVPEFMAWGAWNASFKQTDGTNGLERQDFVTSGFFVAGAPTDPNNIPATGIAEYNGIAVGQRQDLNFDRVDAVGGTVQMTYDFGSSLRTFDIAIDQVANPGLAEIEILGASVFEGDTPDTYQVFQSGSIALDVSGQFFAAGNDPVGATGGEFRIEDTVSNIVVNGVYAADRSN